MNTGERIRELREAKGLSQDELAKKLGYSHRSVISDWEKDGSGIRINNIEKIAAALGCDPGYLTGWQNDQRSENNSGNIIGRDQINHNTNIYGGDLAELVDIYNKLDKKKRTKLMAFAYDLEENIKKN